MRKLLPVLVSLLIVAGNAFAADSLRILAWPGYVSNEAIHSFQSIHNVSVSVTVINSDEDLWAAGKRNEGSDFDLIAVNTAELQRYIDADLVAPIRVANIPNTKNQISRFRKLAAIPGLARDGNIYAIPYTYSAMGLIYNRKLTKAPTSMAAMWDPVFRGKVLTYNGSTQNFSMTALTLGIRNPFRLSDSQSAQVLKRLLQLRDNVLQFYDTPDEVVTLFRTKEIALAFANYGDQQVETLRKAGLDIGYVIPNEGALAWLDCWAVTRRTPDRKLAEAWIDHMLTPEIAHQLTETQGLANTLHDASKSTTESTDKLVWLEPVENPEKRAWLWERVRAGAPRRR